MFFTARLEHFAGAKWKEKSCPAPFEMTVREEAEGRYADRGGRVGTKGIEIRCSQTQCGVVVERFASPGRMGRFLNRASLYVFFVASV